jgi:hypothetical protein
MGQRGDRTMGGPQERRRRGKQAQQKPAADLPLD